jgi:hypothetical protein
VTSGEPVGSRFGKKPYELVILSPEFQGEDPRYFPEEREQSEH